MHWIAPYVGMRHKPGGRGPKEVDCWGLVFLVYQEKFGITLPEFPGIFDSPVLKIHSTIQNEIDKSVWTEVPHPFDGAVIGMGHSKAIHHVGIAIFSHGTKIVHACPKSGVIAETQQTLRYRGFRTIKYYRHVLWPTS